MPADESKYAAVTLSDTRLVTQIQARQDDWNELFGQLVARHQPALYARCMTYLRHPADAADASQDTLLRAYRAIDSFKGDAAFRTWLFAIADNQCHTVARRRAAQRIDQHTASMVSLHEEIRRKPIETNASCSEGIHSALERLNPNSRDVLQLRYFADLSIEEIAVTLGLGISAAKMRLYRAQDQVARHITDSALRRTA